MRRTPHLIGIPLLAAYRGDGVTRPGATARHGPASPPNRHAPPERTR